MDPLVTYDVDVFLRAGFGVEPSRVLHLRPANVSGAEARRLLDEVIVEFSDEVDDEIDPQYDTDELDVQIQWSILVPDGVLVLFPELCPDDIVEVMLERFSDGLAARGVVGHMSPVEPPWNRALSDAPPVVVEAICALPVDQEAYAQVCAEHHGNPPSSWGVDAELGRRVIEHFGDWVLTNPGPVRVSVWGVPFEVEPYELLPLLLDTVPHTIGVEVLTGFPGERVRRIWFGSNGLVGAQLGVAGRAPHELVPELVQLLVDTPEATVAFVSGQTSRVPFGRETFTRSFPPVAMAGQRSPLFMDCPVLSLERTHVHGAFVAQVLTAAQMERTRDLGRWDVTALDDGRWLVSDPNPQQWMAAVPRDEWTYAHEYVTPADVVAAAFEDFGEAVMTPQMIEAYPRACGCHPRDVVAAEPPATAPAPRAEPAFGPEQQADDSPAPPANDQTHDQAHDQNQGGESASRPAASEPHVPQDENSEVAVDLDAFIAAGFQRPPWPSYVHLAPTNCDVDTARRALDVAAGPLQQEWLTMNRRARRDDLLRKAVATPWGAMVEIREMPQDLGLARFLEALRASLNSQGITGRLTPKRFAGQPYMSPLPALTLFATLPADLDEVRSAHRGNVADDLPRWWLDPATSREVLAPWFAWALELDGNPQIAISDLASFPVRPGIAFATVLHNLAHSTSLAVTVRNEDGAQRRLHIKGTTIGASTYDLASTRQEQFDDLTRLMLATPRATTTFIAEGYTTPAGTRSEVLRAALHAPLLGMLTTEWDLLHLERDHVYAPFVRQVLTSEQLARTHDLSQWDVQDLGDGRHLVTHPDPELWFGSPHPPEGAKELMVGTVPWHVPEDEVLRRAIEDFGDAVLTLPTTLENPPFLDPADQKAWLRRWRRSITRRHVSDPRAVAVLEGLVARGQ